MIGTTSQIHGVLVKDGLECSEQVQFLSGVHVLDGGDIMIPWREIGEEWHEANLASAIVVTSLTCSLCCMKA
jgi:hypothetical protein